MLQFLQGSGPWDRWLGYRVLYLLDWPQLQEQVLIGEVCYCLEQGVVYVFDGMGYRPQQQYPSVPLALRKDDTNRIRVLGTDGDEYTLSGEVIGSGVEIVTAYL